MSEIKEVLLQIIQDLESKSKSAKNFAELEEDVFQAVQKFGRTALQGYGDELIERNSEGVKKTVGSAKKSRTSRSGKDISKAFGAK
jgi:translation initiation factor IF-3